MQPERLTAAKRTRRKHTKQTTAGQLGSFLLWRTAGVTALEVWNNVVETLEEPLQRGWEGPVPPQANEGSSRLFPQSTFTQAQIRSRDGESVQASRVEKDVHFKSFLDVDELFVSSSELFFSSRYLWLHASWVCRPKWFTEADCCSHYLIFLKKIVCF